jgi:hypothetical protein
VYPVDDFVVQDAETVPQAKSVNLNFEQSVNRLLNFILYLAGATETQAVLIRQKIANPGCIP